jgi:hypothetical protein
LGRISGEGGWGWRGEAFGFRVAPGEGSGRREGREVIDWAEKVNRGEWSMRDAARSAVFFAIGKEGSAS